MASCIGDSRRRYCGLWFYVEIRSSKGDLISTNRVETGSPFDDVISNLARDRTRIEPIQPGENPARNLAGVSRNTRGIAMSGPERGFLARSIRR